MRPDSDDTESTLVAANVIGIATINASAIPADAIAIVRQASTITMRKNSAPISGGKKSPIKRLVTFRFSALKKIQGLNSVAIRAGINNTSAKLAQATR
jgi:hypothetical protein